MKKQLTLIILLLICLTILAGCGCNHEWVEADCATAKHCALCEEVEGEPLGHVWQAATCEAPVTCEVCGATEGSALGHIWLEATCEVPQTCQYCNATEGEPLEHTWEEATCETARTCTVCQMTDGDPLAHVWQEATTDAPKTCTVCAATEGEKITADARFTTAQTKDIQGTWTCTFPITEEAVGDKEEPITLDWTMKLTFGNSGALSVRFVIADEKAFMDGMLAYTMEDMYADFEAKGYTREEADAAMEALYDMSVEEYVRQQLNDADLPALVKMIFGSYDADVVYYVEDGKLYIGDDWDSEMSPSEFTLENGELYIDYYSQQLGEDTHLTRVSE